MSKAKPGPPKERTEFSSNWKKLQATLEPKKKKRKAEELQTDHKQKKRKESSTDRKRSKMTTEIQKGQDKETRLVANKVDSKMVKKNEIWFDDVDEMLLERPALADGSARKDPLLLDNAVTHNTKALAMDCEMVGVGKEGAESVLARVSIVNQHGHCVYDKFVKAREKVTDFRTHVSGIRPHNLRYAEDFPVVQKEVSDLLKGKILVGHALHNDLKVLFLDHPRKHIRDTSRYKPFRQLSGGRNPSLKKLSAQVLGVEVQTGEHNSIQDAQAAMRLYMMHRKRWEAELKAHGKGKKPPGKKKKKTVTAEKVHLDDES